MVFAEQSQNNQKLWFIVNDVTNTRIAIFVNEVRTYTLAELQQLRVDGTAEQSGMPSPRSIEGVISRIDDLEARVEALENSPQASSGAR